jgi:hypothetical protein
MMVVLYAGGDGGNLVAAIVDSSQYFLDIYDFKHVEYSPLTKWKESCTVWDAAKTNDERWKIMDDDFHDASKNFPIIASHRIEYHINRRHNMLIIESTSPAAEQWRLSRLTKIFPWWDTQSHPAFNNEKNKQIQMRLLTAMQYTDKIIKLEDIINGKLIKVMKQWTDLPLNEELYKMWLDANV